MDNIDFNVFKKKLSSEYKSVQQKIKNENSIDPNKVNVIVYKYLQSKIYGRQKLNRRQRYHQQSANRDPQSFSEQAIDSSLKAIGYKLLNDEEYQSKDKASALKVIKNKLYFIQSGCLPSQQQQLDKSREKIVKRIIRESPFLKLLNKVSEKELEIEIQQEKRNKEYKKELMRRSLQEKAAKLQAEQKHLMEMDKNIKAQKLYSYIKEYKRSARMKRPSKCLTLTGANPQDQVQTPKAKTNQRPRSFKDIRPSPINLIHKSPIVSRSSTVDLSFKRYSRTPNDKSARQPSRNFFQTDREYSYVSMQPSTASNQITQRDRQEIADYLQISSLQFFGETPSLVVTGSSLYKF